jgi:hypothetical protein
MAGYFPDAPDHKVYYNDDGTFVFTQGTGGGATSPLPGSEDANRLNGENPWANASGLNATTRTGFAFPQSMNIVGIYVATNGGGVGDNSGILRTSVDTTNGSDGTWTAPTTTLGITAFGDPSYTLRWRTHIQTVSCLGIKGLTISTGNSQGSGRSVHLYGRPAAGANPDRLRFWHPTTDTEVLGPHFDYGDLLQGQSAVVQFRVKNNSTTKTANAITVADDSLHVSSPTLASQTTFSSDGTTYSATLNIGNLAPGALSAVLRARLVLVGNAQVGPWRQRFKATPGTWV